MSVICDLIGHKFSLAETAGMRVSQTFHGNSWTPVSPKTPCVIIEEKCTRCGFCRNRDFSIPMKDIEWAIDEVNRERR